MAGTSTDFDSAAFRTAIRSAMVMAQPTTVSERVTFRFSERKTFAREDLAANPYDWTSPTASDVAVREVQVACAVQFGDGTPGDNPIGLFDTSKVVLTLLDEDYEQVRDADLVLINGRSYQIEVVAPPAGLFDATIYQMHLRARG